VDLAAVPADSAALVETAASAKVPTDLFWQRLLAAEVSPAKGRALIEELGPLGVGAADALLQHPVLTDGERRRAVSASREALHRGLAHGVSVLTESDYPELLTESVGMSPALYLHGNASCLAAPTIAIVGTRSASTYGKACAHKFAEAFGRAGVTVVSGGALGIDAAAHKGALEGGGRTVAVLAAGVDNVYPAVHAGLFNQIQQSGCLMSQFALGTKPSDYKFLVRNALIAAVSLAVVVIEAPTKSGAIRTAQHAAELGRAVFVVPGDVDRLTFRGSFGLIRDGATLVSHPDEVMEELGIEPVAPVTEAAPPTSVGERILAVLTTNPLATELIVERSGLDTAEVLAELTMLELDGRVLRDSGGYALRP